MKLDGLRIMTAIRVAELLFLVWLIGSILAYASVRLWVIYLKVAYPFPYRQTVVKYSCEAKLDPFLVAALIRNESRFRTNVISDEGAIGLMQLIPETANWVAGEMGIGNIEPGKLDDPELNLKLGTWYLAYLLREFNGSIACAIAAYNCGLSNVKRWLSDGTWSGELEAVHQIPFPETRDFVRNVIRDSKRYAAIYSTPGVSIFDYFPGNMQKGVEAS